MDNRPWLPLPGPQTQAFLNKADQLFYGGQAGGGKTDLMLGLSATVQFHSIIFRREFPRLKAVEDRAIELFHLKHGKYNRNDHTMRFYDGRVLELGAMEHLNDKEKYQGRPHDFKGFDEITQFLELQYRYVIGWLRTIRRDVKERVIAAGNPPTNADGRWVIPYWGPWLDDTHPNPAQPGELRWYITDENGKDMAVEDAGVYRVKGKKMVAHSRTFIPSALKDNPYIKATYAAALSSLPEPLRSQLMEGNFNAGIQDDPYQLFPTIWLKAAVERWKARKEPTNIPIQQLGVDVARGGNDSTVRTPRRGNYFCKQLINKGVTTNDGPKVATLCLQVVIPGTVIAIDAIGIGSSPLDFLRENKMKVMPIVGSEGSDATDKSGLLQFKNVRTEIFWKLREDLNPESGMDLAIPDDPELMQELAAMRFKLTVGGIQVLSKDEVKALIGRSPDKGDSLVYAHATITLPNQGILDYYEELYKQKLEAAETERVKKQLESKGVQQFLKEGKKDEDDE